MTASRSKDPLEPVVAQNNPMYWAHSDPDGLAVDAPGSRAQLLSKHLANVAQIAQTLASAAAPGDSDFQQMASAAGMLHDLGKYTACFQSKIIHGSQRRCPHAIFGALAAQEDPSGVRRTRAYPVAAVIAAHHGGLADGRGFQELLRTPEAYADERAGLRSFWQAAIADQPAIPGALALIPSTPGRTRADLLMRMLLSCLVDADRLDTAGRDFGLRRLDAATALGKLNHHLHAVAKSAALRGTPALVLDAREAVQQACHRAACAPHKLFSLSVPTGGGKTLAAMRFALERAAAEPEIYRRVLVVIPFLSIIEQNAKVYSDIFGSDAVLEHHSGAAANLRVQNSALGGRYYAPVGEEELSGVDAGLPAQRAEVENWDAAIIVTTSVRFFESLFSNHPSDLRRVHNIARSIIVLDEVQTLPRRLLAPLLAMLRELTEDWGCTVLMTTATQPAFEQPHAGAPASLWSKGSVREIIEDPSALHLALERVRIEWRLERPTLWSELAMQLWSHPQVLCVVNVREHAATLFEQLWQAAPSAEDHASIFHLSTRMCAQHRLDVLARVRERLQAGAPCRVVSTQLIEAGVDVDFPVAYRALGPLDAIIQVAGRVDREGKATASAGKPAGVLIVFQTEDGKTPPNDYQEATGITAALAGSREIRPSDLPAMRRYFERFYGEADERTLGKELAEMREDRALKFRTLAEQFEMINTRTRDVFVHYGAGKALLDRLVAIQYLDWRLLRELQRYSVGLQPWEFDLAREAGQIVELSPESGVWISSSAAYDEGRGLIARQDERKLVI